MLTAVMNCFHTRIPYHSRSVFCIIPHDNPYPCLTTARLHCLQNGSVQVAALYWYSMVVIFYSGGSVHVIFFSPPLLLQYDTIHTFTSFMPLDELQ